mgnify:CR=1 FL=1
MGLPSKIAAQLRAICGQDAVLTDEADLLVFEFDAVTTHKAHPLAVILPQTTEQVAQSVRLLAEHGIPYGPRGAGTGLSSGALAIGCEKGEGAVIIEMARMNRILELDVPNLRAVVEPGVAVIRKSA